MGKFWQHPTVRVCRRVFRWMRMTVWLVILAVVLTLGYFRWVGLPDFVKNPVLRHLRERGYVAQFSRMRLGFGPSIIIENASFQRASDQPEPKLSAARAELFLTAGDLARGRVAVQALEVANARAVFPPAGQGSNALSLDNVQLELVFVTTNFVRLTNTTASFRGVRLSAHGELDHAEALREWKTLEPGAAKTSWQALLARTTDVLDQIHFAKVPRVEVDFSADARDWNTTRAHLNVIAPDVTTPWGDARRIRLHAACARPLSTNAPILRVELGIDDVATPWAQGAEIWLTTVFSRDDDANILGATEFSARQLDGTAGTNRLQSSGFRWEGTVGLSGTNFHLLRAGGDLRMTQAESPWVSGRAVAFHVDGTTVEPPAEAGADWGFWAKLARYRLAWSAAGTNIVTPKLTLDSLALGGEWRAPVASVSRLDCALYDGRLTGEARLDVGTRELTGAAHATFDERRVAPLLTATAQRWLAQFDWKTPPDVSGQLRLVLPAWTNRQPDWGAVIRPTLQIAGEFTGRNGSFRGLPVDLAQGRFGYTNRVWMLPRLRASRPDGEVEFTYAGSDETHEYYFEVDSAIDPKAAAPLLPEAQRHWLDEGQFTTPPRVHAEVWGKWRAPELIGVRADISASNFVAHGESVDSFSAALEYTNRFLRVRDARFMEGKQYGTAGLVEVDLATKHVYLTNVLGAVSSELVRRVSAPRTPKWLQLIQFDQPPAVRISGSFQPGEPLATDLRFEVLGQRFHFTNIVADKISGGVHWTARHVVLTNVQAALYNTGSLVGWCVFDYVPKHGSEFRFDLSAKDVDLPLLATSLTGRTNKLEGMLDGQLAMEQANSTDKRTWNGHGQVHVHNALLWDIKIFGIFSPVLNAIAPGSGSSRAYEASADYVITNGVVATDNLLVHSTGFRLLYRGSVDSLTKQIDGRAEAEMLRDTWGVGPLLGILFSPLSKLFEYKISGDLRNPKKEPLYIPQPLMMLLRPFHTLKSLGESQPAPDADQPAAGPLTSPNKK